MRKFVSYKNSISYQILSIKLAQNVYVFECLFRWGVIHNHFLQIFINMIYSSCHFLLIKNHMEEQEINHDDVKKSVLNYVQNLFQEIEEGMAISHQEKYALLEDAFENATDIGELRIAFEQWYSDHANDVDFDQELDELWDQAVAPIEE